MTSIIKVDNIQNSSGTSAISVDSNGVVTKGTLPAFNVGLTGDENFSSHSTWHTISNWVDSETNAFVQGGMSLSSGVITVPVTGVYHFNLVTRIDGVGGGYIWTQISKNNDDTNNVQFSHLDGSPDGSYKTLVCSGIYQMTANDTVRAKIYSSSDTSFHCASQSHFNGFLIG
jgi:hypothetical protein